jgi:A/G-specific adenine glycosylase
MPVPSGPAKLARLRSSLLSWYAGNQRDLPWRRTRDPYRIWISEVMLQQTRVAVVIDRYEEFLTRFPTVHALAAARQSSVVAAWSGLGYYRRARNLHAAARLVASRYRGLLPRDAVALRALPGIGRYTAAAISSIAFDEPVAVLDGNVERVLGRLFGEESSAAESWRSAQSLLDPRHPADFNQAMMELGATVCVPSAPECTACPLRKFCRTRGRGGSGAATPPRRKRRVAYLLDLRRDSVRLVRRPKDAGLMPGMWELPESAPSPVSPTLLFSLNHSITVTNFSVAVLKAAAGCEKGRWVRISRLHAIPLTGLARKILRTANVI